MAEKIIEHIADAQGKEAQLTFLGRFFLVLGIIGLFVSIGVVIYSANFFWFAAGISGLVFGIIMHIALGAIAEIIRLLKLQAGLNYSGKISQPDFSMVYKCSQCSGVVSGESTQCTNCGAFFDKKQENENSNTSLNDQPRPDSDNTPST